MDLEDYWGHLDNFFDGVHQKLPILLYQIIECSNFLVSFNILKLGWPVY